MAVVADAGEWPYRTSRKSFNFHADFPLDPNQKLVTELVQLQSELSNRLQIAPQEQQIDVYLFGDRSIYELYMQRYFPSVTARRAMFIKSNSPGNVFAYISPEFDVDLRHESTHALLHTCLPMVPLWLDEGLAEYFEVPAGERAYDNAYLGITRRRLHWQRPPSLTELESISQLKDMGAEEYRKAWAWVHFMLHGPPEAQAALLAYLESISRHEPPRPLSAELASRFASPEKELVRHFRGWQR